MVGFPVGFAGSAGAVKTTRRTGGRPGGPTTATSFASPADPLPVLSATAHPPGVPARIWAPPVVVASIQPVSRARRGVGSAGVEVAGDVVQGRFGAVGAGGRVAEAAQEGRGPRRTADEAAG